VPRRLLGDAKVAVQLHVGHALNVGREQVERQRPLTQWQLEIVHDRPGLDPEIPPAVATAEGHWLTGGKEVPNGSDFDRSDYRRLSKTLYKL
jgi:hypothetical protein